VVQTTEIHGGMMIVESPVRDTVVNPPVALPCSFVTNQEFSVEWKVRFTNLHHATIAFGAFLDSIYLPDSLRSYSAQSYAVNGYMHVSRGAVYTTEAYSPDMPLFP
jgi:hypothetical protein